MLFTEVLLNQILLSTWAFWLMKIKPQISNMGTFSFKFKFKNHGIEWTINCTWKKHGKINWA